VGAVNRRLIAVPTEEACRPLSRFDPVETAPSSTWRVEPSREGAGSSRKRGEPAWELHVILDNVKTHKRPAVRTAVSGEGGTELMDEPSRRRPSGDAEEGGIEGVTHLATGRGIAAVELDPVGADAEVAGEDGEERSECCGVPLDRYEPAGVIVLGLAEPDDGRLAEDRALDAASMELEVAVETPNVRPLAGCPIAEPEGVLAA
jgi:hypothetical protein